MSAKVTNVKPRPDNSNATDWAEIKQSLEQTVKDMLSVALQSRGAINLDEIYKEIKRIEQEELKSEKNIRLEEELLQYRVDFFIEPSNLDGIPNDSRAVEIADKMLYGNNPAVHRTAPVLVGKVAKVTQVEVLR